MSDFPATHLTQVQKLDALMSKDFDDAAGSGPMVPLPDVIALGIGPYSRRFEDLRRLYKPMGFDVVNTLERGADGITRSSYQKVRVGHPQADRPDFHFQPAKKQTKRKSKPSPETLIPGYTPPETKSWDYWKQQREKQPQQAAEFRLVP